MRLRRARRWIESAAATVALATGLFVVPDVAHAGADGGDGDISAQVFHTFDVVNNTAMSMVYAGHTGNTLGAPFDNDGVSPVGTSFAPAVRDSFQLTWWFGMLNSVLVHYDMGGSRVSLEARVDAALGLPYLTCRSVPAHLRCDVVETSASQWEATVTTATPHYTVVGDDQAQRQVELLNALCDTQAVRTCSFTPTNEITKLYGEMRRVGWYEHFNCRETSSDSYTVRWTAAEGGSHSLSKALQFGLEIKGIVSLGVEHTESQTWGWERTETVTRTLKVPPNHTAWFEQAPARLEVVGDFTATIGNDTILVKDVRFQAPPLEGELTGIIATRERLITDQERADICKAG